MPKYVNRTELREQRKFWQVINVDVLSDEQRSLFNKRKLAVDLYIDGADSQTIENMTGFNASRTRALVKRCSEASVSTGEIPGYAGALQYKRINKRKSKIETLVTQFPKIRDVIMGVYLGDKKYTSERNPKISTVHVRFLEECRNVGLQAYDFPFAIKDSGYRSLCRFINTEKDKHFTPIATRQGKDQMQQLLSTGYGESYTQNPTAPYEVVQIDGHIIDLLTTVETEGADGQPITLTATRIWLIAVIDVCTRCIIGYSVSPHFNYNQYDVLEAIKNSIKPHEHKPFELKSIEYPAAGGFPSEVIPESRWACFNTIMLDNAKAHLASHVVNKLTEQLKCCMNYGSVATPETRGIVERFFGTLEHAGFHKLPNTTGSNPQDPKRKDPEKAALKYKVRYEDVCDILEYLIATYNNSAHGSLRNYSPLQEMEQRMKNRYMPCYLVPAEKRDLVEKLTHFTVDCILRGGYASGKQPRINYEGATYHALNLRIPESMVGESVYIEVDPADVSRVKMFRNDGTYFCEMIAEGEYGRVPHSLKTRRMALKSKNERKDPESIFNPDLTKLTEELKERGKKDRRSRTKADTIIREAKGALNSKGPAEVIDLYPTAENTPSIQPLRKAVGENPCDKSELTFDEINAIFAKYPNDTDAAINEINRLMKG